MDTGDYIAVYGALLATVLAVVQWRRDRGRFVLNSDSLHVTWPGGEATYRTVEVVNVGTRTLYLDDFGFRTKNGESVSLRSTHDEYPVKLEEGQKHKSFAIAQKHFPASIEYFWARDTSGKEYRSDSFPFKE
jgi:hypothetical protein